MLHPKIFEHEGVPFIAEESHQIRMTSFKHYPFAYLSIETSKLDRLKTIYERAVSVRKFVRVYADGADYSEINQKLPGNKFDFTSQSVEEVCESKDCVEPYFSEIKRETQSAETFAFAVISEYKKISRAEQITKIEILDLPQIQGRCHLKKPDRTFVIAELNDWETKKLRKVFFGKDILGIYKRVPFHTRYDLRERLMLGPTSTDHNLAFFMANLGQVSPGDFVVDPFLGTGSILVACAHFNALCYGSEIGRSLGHRLTFIMGRIYLMGKYI